jgi:hypothetical protein
VTPFGRKTPEVTAAESDLLAATPNSTFWDYDEQALRLTNSALDAELSLSGAALATAEADRLSPIEATCRAGNVACTFTIERRRVKFDAEHPERSEFQVTWWCVDYAKAVARVGGSSASKSPQEVDAGAWRHFDRALGEGLEAFTMLMPRNGDNNCTHFIGGHLGNLWLPGAFRSFGPDGFYTHSRERQDGMAAQTRQGPNVPSAGWEFEDGEQPRIVHRASGETLIHQGADPSLIVLTMHWFLYQGALGQYRLPVTIRILNRWEPQPRAWEVDFRPALEIRYGSARDRFHPEVRGEARISESDWRSLVKILTEGLLRWPRCEATGAPPVWIERSRLSRRHLEQLSSLRRRVERRCDGTRGITGSRGRDFDAQAWYHPRCHCCRHRTSRRDL